MSPLSILTAALLLLLALPASVTACPDCACAATATPAAAAQAEEPRGRADTPGPAHHRAPAPDRAAILAMAGEYEVTFQFQETVAIDEGYELTQPYHAEATEFVKVIEDRGDFISLQHVLVLEGDGPHAEPRVVKHWRQDWTYEDTRLLEFKGHRRWEHVTLPPHAVRGTWSQAVYQVDDSPRYEAVGRWVHTGACSAWESAETWRPLPRREHTQRNDYHVLIARNRHTITPNGWVHEQDNRKVVLDDAGVPRRVIAHESGLNVYDRTDDVDFTAGRLYWEKTAAFWQDVRAIWSDTLNDRATIRLAGRVDGKPLHAHLFGLANDAREEGHSNTIRLAAARTVDRFVLDRE